ncbi:aspartyl-phosphate phosphatase Spo0E family protein [Alkalihalophilus sp. As8PL]|uniref:Aspartyl-phosphate phosphatase Spo0E family protein n=1 Tax=Alkalihalophilus sp. As8PL TaxID=3237103 RepID=A0AB39BU27_9BACI
MLRLKIELKRRQMLILAKKHGFTHKETVKCSQELDQLLNKLQVKQTTFNHERYVN